MSCYQREVAKKILMKMGTDLLSEMILDDMSCTQLEKLVSEN